VEENTFRDASYPPHSQAEAFAQAAILLLKRFNSPENRKQDNTEILARVQTVGRPTIIPVAVGSITHNEYSS
jgi:hypothetical protein